MKNTFFIFTLLISITTYGGVIEFVGPCSEQPLISKSFDISQGQDSVGEITLQTLFKNNIPFTGSSQGFSSILDTPTGMGAIEVISDTEMMAYGWCYKVNDFEPAEFPDQVFVRQDDRIQWWFGYAHYKAGKWITQCTPSYLRRSQQFCTN